MPEPSTGLGGGRCGGCGGPRTLDFAPRSAFVGASTPGSSEQDYQGSVAVGPASVVQGLVQGRLGAGPKTFESIGLGGRRPHLGDNSLAFTRRFAPDIDAISIAFCTALFGLLAWVRGVRQFYATGERGGIYCAGQPYIGRGPAACCASWICPARRALGFHEA